MAPVRVATYTSAAIPPSCIAFSFLHVQKKKCKEFNRNFFVCRCVSVFTMANEHTYTPTVKLYVVWLVIGQRLCVVYMCVGFLDLSPASCFNVQLSGRERGCERTTLVRSYSAQWGGI